MKAYFTEEEKATDWTKVLIEEDDVLVEGEVLEGSGKHYILTGKATIEGEIYHDFQVEFELLEEPEAETCQAVMQVEWDWYDYVC